MTGVQTCALPICGIVTLPNGVGLGPLICYEDIVPDLARQAVRQGAQVLVNLTNDVWFGATRAPYQHRALATFRAVENRVYLVRVTNTGRRLLSMRSVENRQLYPSSNPTHSCIPSSRCASPACIPALVTGLRSSVAL